jgi:hypothetical protein
VQEEKEEEEVLIGPGQQAEQPFLLLCGSAAGCRTVTS